MKQNRIFFLLLFSLIFLIVNINAQSIIKMNEIYSRGVAGNLDWVEIYNSSSSQVDISGYKIYDGGGKSGTKTKKLFPANTILPAKGYTIIIVDTASFVGDLSGFGLGSGGDTTWLENVVGTLIDSAFIPALGIDTAYARIPDGSTVWQKTAPVTKGSSNVLVKMNEIYSRGVAGNLDWVEIYNSSSTQIDISGYKIYDGGGKSGTKTKKLIPASTILSAKGFTVVIVDTASFVGDLSGFGLGSGGDTTWLENTAGILIDSVIIPALGNDTSIARVPDGSNILVKKSPVTKGATNGTGTSVQYKPLTISTYNLEQNFPNPFNPTTMISYRLSGVNQVTMKIYDVVGREVATLINQQQAEGEYHVTFNASALSSGIYFYRLNAGNYSEMKKMVLIK